MKVLDFQQVKKRTMALILIDGTELHVKMPTKKTYESFLKMEEADGDINSLYKMASEILSFNTEGKEITTDYISELLDIEDLTIIFEYYTEFITSNSKN